MPRPIVRKTGRYVHPQAEAPRPQDRPLTQEERKTISAAVANITRFFRHLSNAQSVAFVYALLCGHFGVAKTEQLTPHQLTAVLEYLRALEKDSHAFYQEQYQREQEWRDNQLRALAPPPSAQGALPLN
jgi:hypothetical protein